MSKRVALKDSVMVDGVQLGPFCRDVRSRSEHERVDVSGFTDSGRNEYLAGQTEQDVTCEFYGAYGTAETHQTLEPIHSGREIVPFAWRHDVTTPAAVDNPELRGNVQLLSYGPGATRGQPDTFTATFTSADEDGLAWEITPAA